MSEWKVYRRAGYIEMRPYVPGEPLFNIGVNSEPKEGDMIARNPVNHEDQWLVERDYFALHYFPA